MNNIESKITRDGILCILWLKIDGEWKEVWRANISTAQSKEFISDFLIQQFFNQIDGVVFMEDNNNG